MTKLFIIISAIITIFGLTEISLAAPCRSEKGGYCAKMAAIAQAQGLENIISGTDIGDLVPGIYKFGLGLVGISALVALIVGGVMYMTAGGSQNQTIRARVWLGNAVFGLVLALLSYLILSTINPNLVRRLELNLPKIEPAPQAPPEGCPGNQIWCSPLSQCTTENLCIQNAFGVVCSFRGESTTRCVPASECPAGGSTGNQCNLSPGQTQPLPSPPPPGSQVACNTLPATQRGCSASITTPNCICPDNVTPRCSTDQRIWVCR